MSAKDNFNQRMSDMFGEPKESSFGYETSANEYSSSANRTPMTYVAVGTTIEGTICSNGDVEIAGTLKGNIEAQGRVTLHTDVNGDVAASELSIPSCNLTGDVDCTGKVSIGPSATVTGNIHAAEITVAGKVCGDLDVDTHITLEDTAIINGKITTDTMSMSRGAIIRGGIEMREADRALAEE